MQSEENGTVLSVRRLVGGKLSMQKALLSVVMLREVTPCTHMCMQLRFHQKSMIK